MKLFKRIGDWERKQRARYNCDLSTPENRRRARVYNLWFDHAVLRGVWTNFHQIAPGVYRANQPTHRRFAKLKNMGIRSVLNLRGASVAAHFLVEEESCRQLGLTLVNCPLQARRAPPREDIATLIRAFHTIEKPFVMHCKSGADRAGFAAAVYLLAIERRPPHEARRMLSLRYLHLKWSRAGVLDHILDRYEACNAKAAIGFDDWITTAYDPADIQSGFDASTGRGPGAQ